MEQHPVPQHIASFEFKLFGNLTVRQFVTLAIPMSLAAVIFFSSLPTVVRLPLAGLVGLFALFAALVPINGRPFDKWIVAFIKAVLTPTQRIWIKESKIPEFLNIVTEHTGTEEKVPESITAQGRERLRSYLRSLPRQNETPLDIREQIAVQRLGLEGATAGGAAAFGKLPPPILWPNEHQQPAFAQSSLPQIEQVGNGVPGRRAIDLSMPEEKEEYESRMQESLPVVVPMHMPAAAKIHPHAKPFALSGLEKKLKPQMEEKVEIAPPVKAQLASEANFTIESVIPIRTVGRKFKLIHGIGKTRTRKLHFAPPEGFDLSKLPIRGERRFEISEELKKMFSPDAGLFEKTPQKPQGAPVVPMANKASEKSEEPKADHLDASGESGFEKVPKQTRVIPKQKKQTVPAKNVGFKVQEKVVRDSRISISGQKSRHIPLSQANLKHAQILPLTNIPNVISGIVTDSGGNPLERIILVIKDSNGIPVRALKTNKLGQFLSATPLSTGTYSIEIESEEHKFKQLALVLEGKIMEPLEIKAES